MQCIKANKQHTAEKQRHSLQLNVVSTEVKSLNLIKGFQVPLQVIPVTSGMVCCYVTTIRR